MIFNSVVKRPEMHHLHFWSFTQGFKPERQETSRKNKLIPKIPNDTDYSFAIEFRSLDILEIFRAAVLG